MSKESLKKWLFSIPPEMRDDLVRRYTGTSTNYIYKRLYTCKAVPLTFKMRIALGLDRASNGQVDFRTMVEDGASIDWEYCAEVLQERQRLERRRQHDEALDKQEPSP